MRAPSESSVQPVCLAISDPQGRKMVGRRRCPGNWPGSTDAHALARRDVGVEHCVTVGEMSSSSTSSRGLGMRMPGRGRSVLMDPSGSWLVAAS
jgi:hypothetical protein